MAVTPADLLAPAGPVEATLFPGEGNGTAGTELESRLSTYITRAVAKVSGIAFPDQATQDNAVKEWALHLTFDAAVVVAASRPASENTMVQVLGSHGYAKDQRDTLKNLALDHLNNYRAVIASIPATSQPLGIPSRQTTNRFEW